MSRHRLTDEQWNLIADLFPLPAKTGRPPTDRRQIVDGILWILRSGAPWRDLPEEEFGPWETIYGLFNAWSSDGTLNKILRCLQTAVIDDGRIDGKLWCIDGTIVRAHRCAGGGGKKRNRKSRLITH
jgi:transposase